MPTFLSNLPVQAAGSIQPSTFVSILANNDFAVVQCTASSIMPLGISQVGFDRPPGLVQLLPGASYTDVAAASGEEFQIFFDSDVAPLRLGAGGCQAGQLLVADGSGNGIVGTTGQYYGALALQGGNSGEIIQVLVRVGKV
jgi:hypothetical protein